MGQNAALWNFCTYLTYLWSGAAIGMAMYLICHPPILIWYAASRINQLRGRDFELRADRSSHSALHWCVLLAHGVMLPVLFLLSLRTRDFVCLFQFGEGTGNGVSLMLGGIVIAWVIAHLIEPALRLGTPRFDWGWIDRVLSATMLGVCGWFQLRAFDASLAPANLGSLSRDFGVFTHWSVRILGMQGAFLGSSLVALFAVIESWRTPRRASTLHRRLALALGTLATLLIFAPLWLSAPRTPAAQAEAVVAANREIITGYATVSGLDPRLLAGIVRVAQEEHPRLWTTDVDHFGITLWHVTLDDGLSGELFDPLVDPRTGLCGLRPTQIVETLALLRDLPRGIGARMAKITSTIGVGLRWWLNPWCRALRGYESEIRPNFQMATPGSELVDRVKRVIDGTALAAIPLDTPGYGTSAGQMINILCEPKDNLAAAAAILLLLREQWTGAGVDVDTHPEILASLLHDGYRHSRPSPGFRPSAFGRRVAQWMQSDECAALFPLTPQEASHEQ